MAAALEARKQQYIRQSEQAITASDLAVRDLFRNDEEGLNIIYLDSPGKYRGALLARAPSLIIRFISSIALSIIYGSLALLCCCKKINTKSHYITSIFSMKQLPIELGLLLSAAFKYREGQGLKAYIAKRYANYTEMDRVLRDLRPG